MIFKTIEDEAGRTSFAVSDTFNNLISDIQTLFYKKSAKSNFTFLGDFTSSVESDKKAILSYIESVRSGVSPTEALAQCFATASIEAKDFAASLDNVEKISEEAIQGNIAKFESQQKQLNISTQAQNKSLANARTLITEYNAILSDKANKEKEGYTASSKSGLSQEDFCKAIEKSNPPLAKYLSGLHTADGTTRGYVGSLIAAKAATIGLRIATTALNTVLNIGIGLIVQGLLWGLSKLCELIDGIIVTQKEAAEAAEEAVKAYEEQSSKLNDLTKKLEESKKRYKELYDIQQTSSLTFVEEEELDKLKETNKQLELQIANEKELQQIKAEEANEKLTKAFDKQSYTSITYENAVYDYNALKESKKELLDFYSDLEMNAARYADEHNLTDEEYEKYYQGLLDNMGEYQDTLEQLYELEKKWNPDLGASTEIVDYKTYIDEVIQRYNYLNQLKADGNKLSDEQSSQLDKIRNDILVPMMSELKTNYIDKYIGDDDTLNGWKDIYDSIGKALYGAEYFAQKLDELPDVLKTKLEALGKQGALTADNINELSKQYPQLNKWMEQSGYTADDVAKYYNSLKKSVEDSITSTETTIANLNKLSKGFEQLDKIYKDVIDGNGFDVSLIADNKDFKDAFSSLDAYKDFISTIVKYPNDIKKCQDAFNQLTNEYIRQSGVLDILNEDNKELVANYLRAMGVENASAIVDAELAYQKEKLKYSTESYIGATLEEINTEYNSASASEVTKQALAELWLQKVNLNTYKIDASSDIDQIINMANAANAAAASISALRQAKNVLSAVEKGTAAGFHMIESGDYDKALKTIEQINNGTFNYNFQGIDSSKYKSAVYSGADKTYKELAKQDKSSESAANKAAKAAKDAFQNEYNAHKHKVQMELESEKSYYDWLEKRSKEVYDQKIIDEGDYWKYQEEVFDGRRKLYQDYLNDIEHEISMRQNMLNDSEKVNLKETYGKELTVIRSLYKTLISSVESEIAKARKGGLKDTDEYLQSLQDKWSTYRKAIQEIENDAKNAAKDALDELVDYRIDMLKKDVDKEKDALDKKLDNLKEFYDKQKEMLQDAADEEKYLDEQSEKRKSVTDIQSQLAQLEYDNSAWAEKRKAELKQELADAQKELDDFEKDHALELALDAIDDAYNSQEAQLKREMDALDEKLNDPNALYNQALTDIKNNSKNQLYYTMLMYNRQYGDGKDSTVNDMWTKAYGALDDYQKLFGKAYDGVTLKNETGVKQTTTTWDTAKVSGTSSANKTTTSATSATTKTTSTKSSSPSLSNGSSVTIKKTATNFSSKSKGVRMASFVPGGTYTVYQTSGNEVLIGRNGVYTGWVNKSDIVGYATGTKRAKAGIHEIDEEGYETIFESADGARYKLFSGSEKVLNAKASDFLYDFANGGGEILEKIIKSALGGGIFDKIMPVVNKNEINMGDIVIQGDCKEKTVSEIRRAQRENVSNMLKAFNNLNK